VITGLATSMAIIEEANGHWHRKAQLVLTLSGVVTCEVDHNVWIVPPQCAVWIPGGLPHGLKASGNVHVYGLFVEPNAAAIMPTVCCTITVAPFLRELLLKAASFPELYDEDGPDGRVARVLLDELQVAPIENLHCPMPSDPKLRKIANAMMADPSDCATIAEWGRRVGAAERTLARILQRETGMSFGRWRQQLHILIALRQLAEGMPVQSVALDLGYESASAFITMFRKVLGKSPGRYFADRSSSA
jgi:AraC-like DNA-binding protein